MNRIDRKSVSEQPDSPHNTCNYSNNYYGDQVCK